MQFNIILRETGGELVADFLSPKIYYFNDLININIKHDFFFLNDYIFEIIIEYLIIHKIVFDG